jgi:predicted transcriptional regulator
MTFSGLLKNERNRLGLTRAGAAAVLIDVSESWINKAERGDRDPHPWMQAEALTRLRALDWPADCPGKSRKTPAPHPR